MYLRHNLLIGMSQQKNSTCSFVCDVHNPEFGVVASQTMHAVPLVRCGLTDFRQAVSWSETFNLKDRKG